MMNSIFEKEKPNDIIHIRLHALRLPHVSLTLIDHRPSTMSGTFPSFSLRSNTFRYCPDATQAR